MNLAPSYSTYTGYEVRNREPKYETLCKIADLLQVSTDDLLGRTTNILGNKDDKQIKQIISDVLSEKTIDNYINNNTFIENKHYFINEKNKIEFIPFSIVEFKKNPKHKIKIIEDKKEEKIILSETTSKILKGILI